MCQLRWKFIDNSLKLQSKNFWLIFVDTVYRRFWRCASYFWEPWQCQCEKWGSSGEVWPNALSHTISDSNMGSFAQIHHHNHLNTPVAISDWSFARLIAPVVTTTSITLSSNKIQNWDILVPANPGPPGKWPLKRRETETDSCSFNNETNSWMIYQEPTEGP